jgi:hypothetical protein
MNPRRWLLLVLVLAACATQRIPVPAPNEGPALTPYQCEEIRKRGGRC